MHKKYIRPDSLKVNSTTHLEKIQYQSYANLSKYTEGNTSSICFVRLLTNYHKLPISKQQKRMPSELWKPGVQNQHYWAQIKSSARLLFHKEALGQNHFPDSSSFLELPAFPCTRSIPPICAFLVTLTPPLPGTLSFADYVKSLSASHL